MNLHDEIEALARQLYEESGRVEGHHLDNRLETERVVHSRYQGQEAHESGSSS